MRKFVEGEPAVLVRNGRILHRNMQREMVTRSELNAALRDHGLDDLSKVKVATMEINGEISVVTKEDEKDAESKKKSDPAQ